MDVLTLLDPVIKIGLGAVIAGGVTYHVANLNHDRELRKIGAVRRLEMIEKASEQAELFFYRWRQLSGALGGIYKGRNAPTEQFSESQWKKISKKDSELYQSREHLYKVMATLRLLGAESAAKSLGMVNATIGKFRDPMILQRITPSLEEFERARKELNASVRTFHSDMSSLYAKL